MAVFPVSKHFKIGGQLLFNLHSQLLFCKVFALVQKLLNSHSKNEHPASIHNIKCQLEKLHRVHKLVQWYTIYLT